MQTHGSHVEIQVSTAGGMIKVILPPVDGGAPRIPAAWLNEIGHEPDGSDCGIIGIKISDGSGRSFSPRAAADGAIPSKLVYGDQAAHAHRVGNSRPVGSCGQKRSGPIDHLRGKTLNLEASQSDRLVLRQATIHRRQVLSYRIFGFFSKIGRSHRDNRISSAARYKSPAILQSPW